MRLPSLVPMALGATLALGAAEVLMREVQFAPRVFNPELGFVVPEGGRTRWAVEGNGTGHYVEDGVRGGASTFAGPTVLVVGDSFTEALHVDDRDTFVARTGEAMRAMAAPTRLLNLGVAGQRTPTYVEFAPAYLKRFSPAWSVIVINDEDLLGDMFDTSGTYFRRDSKADSLTLQRVPLDSGGSGLRKVWRLAKSNSALLQRIAIQGAGFRGEMKSTHLFRAEEHVAVAPAEPASNYPIQAALDLLFAAYNDRLSIVFLARADERAPNVASEVEQIVLNDCQQKRRSCVSTRAENAKLLETGNVPYGHPNVGRNVGHLNALGHEAVGKTLARELKQLRDHGLF